MRWLHPSALRRLRLLLADWLRQRVPCERTVLLNSIREPLEVVVLNGSEVIQRLVDHRHDPVDTHILREVEHETLPEHIHGVGRSGSEARHLVGAGHHFDQQHDTVHVFPGLQQPADDQSLEVLEVVRCVTAHHVNVLLGELERRSLEAYVAGRVGEAEPVVDMDDVSLAVEQYIAVMSVPDLQQVGHYGIRCVALDEILAGLEDVVGKDALKRLGNRFHVEFALHDVHRARVVQELYDTAIRPGY
ncbi:octaprenyl-diphosphate synthase, putative [Babesia ovata]|uniref:Octaprenyl-diphosphate synthase, putative n=1 Tax=Babesia ovata TaxID=189622 RepID=A0A2H6KBS3_9APIC|nr:octaprenyl-diphosphate synthase, putative [Babesia ovata]GBE60441.1 octaprenyl-diphosphate synthase, putative [Babesia ovata]